MGDAALPPFPELDDERERLAFARACRDAMIERFERVDPQGAADELRQWIDTALDGRAPLNRRREGLRVVAPDRWHADIGAGCSTAPLGGRDCCTWR
jgi:hypothetical protein